jgi:Tripartite tricarboxylate transporter TctB family
MMWKPIANLFFHVALIVALAFALYASLDWPRETALFPRAVGVPILVLTIVSFALELRRLQQAGLVPERGAVEEADVEDAAFLRGAAIIFVWLIGFGFAIWILGFYMAAFVYLLLYIRIQAKLSLTRSLFWSIATVAVVFVFFSVLLHIEPYHGFLEDLVDL